MSDLISREEAIKAMVKLEQDDIEMYGVKIIGGFDSEPAIKALNLLQKATAVPTIEFVSFLEKIKDEITTYLIRKGSFDGEHGKALIEIRHNICEKIKECSE